jgi:hypothetical protein
MYQFTENSDKFISLRDCKATGMTIGDRVISFMFADGFTIGKKHPRNTYGKTLRTGAAQADFNLPIGTPDENAVCYVFYEKKNGKALRKQFSLEKLMRRVNDCGCPLKFLSLCKGGDTLIYKCELARKKKSGVRECVLVIRTDGVSFRWNELCPGK